MLWKLLALYGRYCDHAQPYEMFASVYIDLQSLLFADMT